MEVNKPIITVVMIIVIVLLLFVFVWPKYQQSKDVEVQLTQLQAEYNGEAVYYTKIDDLLKQIDSRKDEFDKVNSALPAQFALAPVMYFFQQKGGESGLVMRSLTFSQVSPVAYGQASSLDAVQQVKDVNLTLDLYGNYQGLKNFIHALETSSRIFELDTVTLNALENAQSSTSTSSQAQSYDLKLEIKTHSY
jgi:Tfp pilus assembly protein PilO